MLNASRELAGADSPCPPASCWAPCRQPCKLPADAPFAQAWTTHYADAGV
jgi:hypothetical protein